MTTFPANLGLDLTLLAGAALGAQEARTPENRDQSLHRAPRGRLSNPAGITEPPA